jgi:acetyl esterase/lipase
MRRPTVIVLLALGAALGCAAASTPAGAPANVSGPAMRELAPVPLWSGAAPGARGDSDVDRPVVTPFLPPAGRATGSAVVVFAGGGYLRISLDKEAAQAARWLTSNGVAAFVVRYRLGPRYHHPAMLQDALRAVRVVRAGAPVWGIDADRIGVLGFSAGGHMASMAGTRFDLGIPAGADPVDRVSSRPDFMMLVYPVITMERGWSHSGSRTRLLGADSTDSALVRQLSSETQVTRATPPTFLVAGSDDATVPVENSLRFYQALRSARVPVEMHLFEKGRHGFALALDDPALATWSTLAATWMRGHGWLVPRSPHP